MDTPKTEFRSKRIAGLFTETWEQLPQADRRIILDRLTLISDRPGLCPAGKGIERNYLGFAQYLPWHSKFVVWLNGPRLARRKPETTKGTIAHELAHVFCCHDSKDIDGENEAQERLTIWGFDLNLKGTGA